MHRHPRAEEQPLLSSENGLADGVGVVALGQGLVSLQQRVDAVDHRLHQLHL